MNIDRPNEIDAQRDSIHEAAAKRKRNDDAFHNDGEDEGAPVKIRRRQSDSESESSDELIGKVPLGGSDSDGKKSGLLSDASKWRSAGVAETAKQHIPGRHSLSAARLSRRDSQPQLQTVGIDPCQRRCQWRISY